MKILLVMIATLAGCQISAHSSLSENMTTEYEALQKELGFFELDAQLEDPCRMINSMYMSLCHYPQVAPLVMHYWKAHSSLVSNVLFYSTPCYLLSLCLDLRQNYSLDSEALILTKYVCTLCHKIPRAARAKMFKKAFTSPSGFENDFYFPERFLPEFDVSIQLLYYLIDDLKHDEDPRQNTVFDDCIKWVRSFHTYLFDAFNPSLVGKLSIFDAMCQIIKIQGLVSAEYICNVWIHDHDHDDEPSMLRLMQLRDMVISLQRYIKKTYSVSTRQEICAKYRTVGAAAPKFLE